MTQHQHGQGKHPKTGAGRPRVSSRLILEEAAGELFLENGYEQTTVEQITARAGVSRNTFFNYFETKSDLLWGGFDRQLTAFNESLNAVSPPDTAAAALQHIRESLKIFSSSYSPDQIPLALTQSDAMGATSELRQSTHLRFGEIEQTVHRWLQQAPAPLTDDHSRQPASSKRTQQLSERADSELRITMIAMCTASATLAGVITWAEEGPTRNDLECYILTAFDLAALCLERTCSPHATTKLLDRQ